MKINVKMLTEDSLNYVKNNLETITNNVIKYDDNNWINECFPSPIFYEKKYQIEDFELINNPKSEDKDIDLQNSLNIYNSLKDLPRYVLTNECFWAWLHFDKFYKIVKEMMPIKGKSTITDHWFHKQGTRRGLMFGVLSRCYFRVALTVDENKEDPYELTKWVIDNPERYRNLTWRTFSSETHLVRGIIRAEKNAVEYLGKEESSIYKEIAKYVSVIGSVRLLDAISEEDIEKMIYEKMLELLAE